MKPVKLQDIACKLEEVNEDWLCLLNTETGEIVSLGLVYLSIAEEEDFSNRLPWEMELISEARDVLCHWDIYKKLPDRSDIDEYRIMESFSFSYQNETISQQLCDAIGGRGAFQRFKRLLGRLGISDEWYAYKASAFIDQARDWCDFHSIPFVE